MASLTPTTWRNIYSPGDTPTWTVAAGAYAYEVYDFTGLIRTGTSGGGTTLTIPPPAGGWKFGSYRVYVPAQNWSTNFTVIDQTDSRFPTKPTTLTPYTLTGLAGNFQAYGTYDPALHGVFGIGPERWSVADAAITSVGNAAGPPMLIQAAQASNNWYHSPAYADPAHPREQFMQFAEIFPSPTVDALMLYDAAGTNFGNQSLLIHCADPHANGDSIYVAVAAGTVSGFRITVRAPDANTVVETFDNLATPAAAQTAINATSTRIRAFNQARGGTPAALSATAIGNSARTRVASVAADFYAAGVTWFEGPWNEPQDAAVAQIALQYGIWAVSVKQGAPAGKTMGPNPVTFYPKFSAWLGQFLDLVDRTNLDGISVHSYNTHNGDVRLARQCLIDLRAVIAARGLGGLPLWQTEQGWQWPWYGIDRGRDAVSYYMLMVLMQEQFGLPVERNYYWYDVDNSFWLMALVKGNNSHVLSPIAPAFRTLTAERFGKTFTGALDFGTPGNDLYIGNAYAAPDGTKTIILQNCGEGDAGSLTFTVHGATTLSRLDCFGNATIHTVTGGKVTVPVDPTPTYLRVPAGVDITFVPLTYGTDLALNAPVTASGGSKAPASRITTAGLWSHYYGGSSYLDPGVNTPNARSPWQAASAVLPQTVDIVLPTAQTADMAVIRAAQMWQALTTLLDFDVQVSPDGTTWNTVYTYTKDPAQFYAIRETSDSSFPSHFHQWGDERIAWRVPFSRRTVKALRLVIRNTTVGGALTAQIASQMVGNSSTETAPTLSSVQLYNSSAPRATGKYVVARGTL